jgi:hypothetical protein
MILAVALWRSRSMPHPNTPDSAASVSNGADTKASVSATAPDLLPTGVSAHNLLLRKGPNFRFYVRWLRGQMTRTKRGVNPSFDDPDSFALDVQAGVLRANIGDIANFLNTGGMGASPLKNIQLSGDGDQVKLSGTIHKVIPIQVELRGTLSAVENNRIRIHVTKINVLKIPLKAVLGGLHIQLSDLFQTKGIAGVEVTENDIIFDPQTLLPPPRIRGRLTAIRVANPDLEEVYGDAQPEVERTEEWRNFLRLRGGTIDFGKLTMRHVDLIMIDISKDAWFDIDLEHYQTQLVNGYTHMTPQAGLQIFMPDLREIPPSKANKNISLEWLKNRNLPPPAEVYSH